MSGGSYVSEKEPAKLGIEEWTKYFWQMVIDFAIISMASSLVFCSAMFAPFEINKKERDVVTIVSNG